jgi:GTP-binding protein
LTNWKSELLCTAFNAAQLPPPRGPEVVFVGRSNVGKSTLINALLARKIAKVSSKPGKTRSINFYEVSSGGGFFLVDLPGYGYAARSKGERESWWRLVNEYFRTERDIAFVVHLVDFRHGPLANDDDLTAWLDGMDMPRLVVFTKGDKISRGKGKALYQKYVGGGLVSIAPPLVTSGKNDSDAERLRGLVIQIIHELGSAGHAGGVS